MLQQGGNGGPCFGEKVEVGSRDVGGEDSIEGFSAHVSHFVCWFIQGDAGVRFDFDQNVVPCPL